MPDQEEEIDLEVVKPVSRTSLANLTKLDRSTPKTQEGLLHIVDEAFSDYSNIGLTDEEAGKVSKTLKRLSTGASSFTILNCKGSACPFASACPLVQMKAETPHGKAPVGQDCILESTLLRDSLTAYFQEYEVDPKTFTEVNIVAELAEIEVLLWRINMQLTSGQNALLVIDQTIGFDRTTGQAIVQQQVSPLFEQKQKLSARKSKLIKVMVGDRQEKYKKEAALKQKPDSDASTQMSDVKKQLQAIQQKLKIQQPATIDVSPEDFMSGESDKE